MTLLGMLFILIGRHEWDENHRARVRRANQIFGLSLMAGFVTGIEVTLLAVYAGIGAPLWAEVVFGAAVGSFVLGTFVTYAQLIFHLVTRPSKGALRRLNPLGARNLDPDRPYARRGPLLYPRIDRCPLVFYRVHDLTRGLPRIVPVHLVLSPSRGVRRRPRYCGPAACGLARQEDDRQRRGGPQGLFGSVDDHDPTPRRGGTDGRTEGTGCVGSRGRPSSGSLGRSRPQLAPHLRTLEIAGSGFHRGSLRPHPVRGEDERIPCHSPP